MKTQGLYILKRKENRMDEKVKKVKEIGELVIVIGAVAGYVIKGVASVVKIVSSGEKPTPLNVLKEVGKED